MDVSKGDDEQAYQMVRAVVLGHPEDIEAWTLLGDLIRRRINVVGGAWTDARDAYEHVLALDPQNGTALWTLDAIAAREGRRARSRFLDPASPPAQSEARHCRQCSRSTRHRHGRLGRAGALRRRPPRPSRQFRSGWQRVRHLYDGEPDRRAPSLAPDRGAIALASGSGIAHITLAKIELTNGRRDAANAELASAALLDPTTALESRAYFALSRLLEAPRGDLVALRDSVRHLSPVSPIPADDDGLAAMHRPVHRYLRLYLLGLLSARLRDEAAALRYAGDLERADSSTPGVHSRLVRRSRSARKSIACAADRRKRSPSWRGRGSGRRIRIMGHRGLAILHSPARAVREGRAAARART